MASLQRNYASHSATTLSRRRDEENNAIFIQYFIIIIKGKKDTLDNALPNMAKMPRDTKKKNRKRDWQEVGEHDSKIEEFFPPYEKILCRITLDP